MKNKQQENKPKGREKELRRKRDTKTRRESRSRLSKKNYNASRWKQMSRRE